MSSQPQPSQPAAIHSAPPASAPAEAADEISLRELLDIVLSGKWLIAAVTAVATALGGAHALLATPIYEAEALVQVEDQRGGMPGFDSFSGLFGEQSAPAETEIEVLRSRRVLGQVVEDLDLQIDVQPVRFPLVGEFFARRHAGDGPAEPRFGAKGFGWGGEVLAIDRLELAPHLEGRSLELVAGEGGGYTLFDPDGEKLLRGEVGQPQTAEAGDAGEPLVSIFVSELRARADTRFAVTRRSWLSTVDRLRSGLSIRERGAGTGIVQISLEGADPGHLQTVLDGLADVYLRQHVERRSAEAKRSLEFLDEQLPELRAELEAAEEAFNDFRRENQAVDLSADTQHVLEQIVQVEAELAQLELQRVEEAQRFAAQHPRMRTLAEQERQLRAKKAELEGRVGALPDRQQQALRLRREVEVATELYTGLLNTAQELRVMQAGTIGNVRILDYAARPEIPIKPRRSLVGGMSMLLGLMLGVGLVFGRHALRRAVEDPDGLEEALGLPTYTVIPHSRAEERAARRAKRSGGPKPLLARDHPQDPAIEGLRSFRTSLHFALLKAQERVIAVTSPHPASGKSFACMNAGYVFAESGKRVLVIDADLRRGFLHDYVDGERGPGLSEVLAGQIEAREAIRPLSGEPEGGGGVFVLSTGALPPNPSELLMSGGFETLLDELRGDYDLIIVDTPPVLAVTDAAVVGARVGAMFLLVRAGKTQLPEIEAALKRLRHNAIAVTGLLFNDLGARRGGYRHRHYQYEYGSRDR